MSIIWQNRVVNSLAPKQVFVFGSNATGFHGAGSAGLACRGDHRNNWRTDQWFLDAMACRNDRIGHWAMFGVARGIQSGRCGSSYAIQTVVKPGMKRSISRREIYAQLIELWQWLAANPDWEAIITPIGEGYAGYDAAEMSVVWEYLVEKHGTRRVTFCRPSTHNLT